MDELLILGLLLAMPDTAASSAAAAAQSAQEAQDAADSVDAASVDEVMDYLGIQRKE